MASRSNGAVMPCSSSTCASPPDIAALSVQYRMGGKRDGTGNRPIAARKPRFAETPPPMMIDLAPVWFTARLSFLRSVSMHAC